MKKPITNYGKRKGWEWIKVVDIKSTSYNYTEYYYISESSGRYIEHKYKTTWK